MNSQLKLGPDASVRQSVKKSGFTLIELLVVIAIIAILASILFPVFARARENARRSSCLSNVKQMGLAIMQYSQDYDEKYPPVYYGVSNATYTGWFYLIEPYSKSAQLVNCPSATNAFVYSGGKWQSNIQYGMSIRFEAYDTGVSLAAIDNPTQTIVIGEIESGMRLVPKGYENNPYRVYDSPGANPAYRHLETTNLLFADGHVKSLNKGMAEQRDTTKTGDLQFVLWGFPTAG
jgi:prepilin-type N-terminal cleavage/methylation domain-containing protein/prepilin-type processing-associated H-X9-DG protein